MNGRGPFDEEIMQALEPQAGDELERTLARYARVRLDPSPAQARRARAAVMEQAWRARLDAKPAPARVRRRHLFSGWSARRLGISAAAAVLAGLLVGSSAFAASRAGGPLYATRLAMEDLALPSDPASRLEAEIAQAQTRLAEATDAEARGDNGALGASLAAYGTTLAILQDATGTGADRALQAVEFHRTVLLRLVADAPQAALGGLTQALDNSQQAISHLTTTQSGTNGGTGTGGSGTGGNGTGGKGGNGGGAGQPTPAPTPSPAPTRTPRPDVTPKPDHTAKPDHTPKPAPTPPAP